MVDRTIRKYSGEREMVGIYFSGTGNTKYCVGTFLKYYDDSKTEMYSIEEDCAIGKLKESSDIVLGYPVYYSDIPMIVREFINNHSEFFANKNIFIIATMGLFSGDGTGCSARLLKKYGATILGGLHLKMPDCIGDVKALKKPVEKNVRIVREADRKIKRTVENIKHKKYSQDGLTVINHLAGLFGQRLWFYGKPYRLKEKIKIDYKKCVSCGRCSQICPMGNIKMIENKPIPQNKCTCCYRCFSSCPQKAITLIGNKVIEQSIIDKYLNVILQNKE